MTVKELNPKLNDKIWIQDPEAIGWGYKKVRQVIILNNDFINKHEYRFPVKKWKDVNPSKFNNMHEGYISTADLCWIEKPIDLYE